MRSCYAQIAKDAHASSSAVGDALRPTILGETRKDTVKKIMRMQEQEAVTTKGTKRYRELTEAKAREKEKRRRTAGVWGG